MKHVFDKGQEFYTDGVIDDKNNLLAILSNRKQMQTLLVLKSNNVIFVIKKHSIEKM